MPSQTQSDDKKSQEKEKAEMVFIENPGKGSCGIYTIGVGLAPALRQEIMEAKTDQPSSLFQALLPPDALRPPPFEDKVDEVKLAACKRKLKEDVLCYEYKKSYSWPQEVLRFLARRGTKGERAMGLDPFLHRVDKMFRRKLIDHREDSMNTLLATSDFKVRTEQITNDVFLTDIVQLFNHYYCDRPSTPDMTDAVLYEPLRKQIQQYALEHKRNKPPNTELQEQKYPFSQIEEGALRGLLTTICNPPPKRNSVYTYGQFEPALLDPLSNCAKYINHFKHVSTYAGNKDMTQLGELLDVGIEELGPGGKNKNLTQSVTHPVATVVMHHVPGLISLTNHFNTQQTKKEFDEGREHSTLIRKFKKYINFDTYPEFPKEEILGVAKEMTTGRFSTFRTFFSNPQEKTFINQLKDLVSKGDSVGIMEAVQKKQCQANNSSLMNLGLKHLQMRQMEHENYTLKHHTQATLVMAK